MYIVEGNIGVGKSTFCKKIEELAPEIEASLEPITNWTRQDYGSSLLSNFYQDTPRWAYTLETLSMICRARDHAREQEHPNTKRLVERSIYSGYYCFAQNCYHQGNLSQLEWEIYNQWASFLLKETCKAPSGFIYLQAEPPVCFSRIAKRGRESEKELSLEYVQQIHHWHEKFLINKEVPFSSIQNVPVLVLDCNEEFASNTEKMAHFLEKIRHFMQSTSPSQKSTA